MSDEPKKVRGRPFKEGQSGNPAGTSKTPPAVRAFLTDKSMVAATKLVEIIEDADTPRKDVIAACKVLLSFTVAKPADDRADGADATAAIQLLAEALTAPRK
jgi:hypothetical protein